jgi:hypothetical protein
VSGEPATAGDPRVAAAIAHWAPRFVANGVLLADFQEVTAGIARWEDWCRDWCDRAARHERLGREALEAGSNLTAGEHLAREAGGPVELLMVEDGGHNANNRPYRYRSRSADWMAGRLGLPRR